MLFMNGMGAGTTRQHCRHQRSALIISSVHHTPRSQSISAKMVVRALPNEVLFEICGFFPVKSWPITTTCAKLYFYTSLLTKPRLAKIRARTWWMVVSGFESCKQKVCAFTAVEEALLRSGYKRGRDYFICHVGHNRDATGHRVCGGAEDEIRTLVRGIQPGVSVTFFDGDLDAWATIDAWKKE